MKHRPTSSLSKTLHHTAELFTRKPIAEHVDMSGKYVIVTGATPGSIGYEVAKTLAGWGARVVATGLKNIVSLREALRRDMHDGSQCPSDIEAGPLDLSDSASVADFAAWYREYSGGRLDVLVNNAGILLNVIFRWRKPKFSADGFEMHWRTNYLGAFHLTRLLLPMLLESGRRTGDARVINVSSHHHDKGKNDRPFRNTGRLDSWTAYGQSKLALIQHSFELQRRYRADYNLRSVALHPGSVCTNMTLGWLNKTPWLRTMKPLVMPLGSLVLLTPAQAAQAVIHCATGPVPEDSYYYERFHPVEPAPDARDAAAAQRLWEESERWFRSLDQEQET
ncbi:MAG: SDR family NAD(P)-dependent oxidoreductase [Bacteroidetes bacterium SB0662_bin_6]|nr:SDR family NAD(P)-dependent oxidoreductase [Bacteroidetes bacterium SB0668_bin_1]MYE03726.1 SDR family NAD(P)-dependent oxidoreductase [Bacteroidetes bacterium SB0662_bin_6]